MFLVVQHNDELFMSTNVKVVFILYFTELRALKQFDKKKSRVSLKPDKKAVVAVVIVLVTFVTFLS